jgi:hypothetical protein
VGEVVHSLEAITLVESGDADHIMWWPILNIHTWDIDYISGLSFWSAQTTAHNDPDWEINYGYNYNIVYGMSFTRLIPAAPGVGGP